MIAFSLEFTVIFNSFETKEVKQAVHEYILDQSLTSYIDQWMLSSQLSGRSLSQFEI